MRLRVVFDTNVFVAAVLRVQGPAARLLVLWRKRRFCLVFTEETIAETLAVLEELGVGRVPQQRRWQVRLSTWSRTTNGTSRMPVSWSFAAFTLSPSASSLT